MTYMASPIPDVTAFSSRTAVPADTDDRIRPGSLPRPALIDGGPACSGYVATDYWPAEDAVFLHPPESGAVCAVLRGVQIEDVGQIRAAVQAPRRDGPALCLSIGVAAEWQAQTGNWMSFMGNTAHLRPGQWGVVSAPVANTCRNARCDLLISAQVIGLRGNANAWALFRRFAFQARPLA